MSRSGKGSVQGGENPGLLSKHWPSSFGARNGKCALTVAL
jgi:hypothetical protein